MTIDCNLNTLSWIYSNNVSHTLYEAYSFSAYKVNKYKPVGLLGKSMHQMWHAYTWMLQTCGIYYEYPFSLIDKEYNVPGELQFVPLCEFSK